MTQSEKYQATIDKFDIIEVSTISFCCRDTGDWDRLASCFDPEAPITTSWFNGTAREFAAQSKSMMDGHHSTDTQRHMMANPRVTLKGNRAVCEYYLILHQGRTLDGYEFDFQTWSVTLDLFEKRDGKWLIARRKMIYEKSRMDPRMPGSVPQTYFDQLDLSRYPAAVKFHRYRNEKNSGHVPKNLILKGSPEEKAARQEAGQWLAASGSSSQVRRSTAVCSNCGCPWTGAFPIPQRVGPTTEPPQTTCESARPSERG